MNESTKRLFWGGGGERVLDTSTVEGDGLTPVLVPSPAACVFSVCAHFLGGFILFVEVLVLVKSSNSKVQKEQITLKPPPK